MTSRRLKAYGLKESAYDLYVGNNQVAGKKLLMIEFQKLKEVFGGSVSQYQDLWKKGGVVENKIEEVSSRETLATAKRHFDASLSMRKKQSNSRRNQGKSVDKAHLAMIDGLAGCITKIVQVSNAIEDRERGQSTIKQEKVAVAQAHDGKEMKRSAQRGAETKAKDDDSSGSGSGSAVSGSESGADSESSDSDDE